MRGDLDLVLVFVCGVDMDVDGIVLVFGEEGVD